MYRSPFHSVSKLAQRNSNPHSEHTQGVKRILCYLQDIINMKIIYEANENRVEGFGDADWGLYFFIGNCPIIWQSSKQSCVALNSTGAEYKALSEAAKEAIFLILTTKVQKN